MQSGEDVITKDHTHTDCAKLMSLEDYNWFKSLPFTIELKVTYIFRYLKLKFEGSQYNCSSCRFKPET
jgi:hypothetical protein